MLRGRAVPTARYAPRARRISPNVIGPLRNDIAHLGSSSVVFGVACTLRTRNQRGPSLGGGKKIMTSMALICASARGGPEQFYFPRAYAKQWRANWEPQLTESMLQPIARIERAGRKPAVRVAQPGPHELCSCGRARKYKKCCGTPARA